MDEYLNEDYCIQEMASSRPLLQKRVMDNHAPICIRAIYIHVDGELVFENEDLQEFMRLRQMFIYIYELLIEQTNSEWLYHGQKDVFERTWRRTYWFVQADRQAIVTVKFLAYQEAES